MKTKDFSEQWSLYFIHYSVAVLKLQAAIYKIQLERLKEKESKNIDLMLDGLIRRFEYTLDLALNTMKEYAIYQGETSLTGARDAIRWSLSMGLIKDSRWMKSLEDRHNIYATYYNNINFDILQNIEHIYLPLFFDFDSHMRKIYDTYKQELKEDRHIAKS